MKFYDFVQQRYAGQDNRKGDFAKDMRRDKAFAPEKFPDVSEPDMTGYYRWLGHISMTPDSSEALDTFEFVWREYYESTPRVMTWDEVREYSLEARSGEGQRYLWVEEWYPQKLCRKLVYCIAGGLDDTEAIEFDAGDDTEEYDSASYGELWRCWTDKPTKEARTGTIWSPKWRGADVEVFDDDNQTRVDYKKAAKHRETQREWQKRNAEYHREYQREWARRNPDKIREYAKRAARRKALDEIMQERSEKEASGE